MRIFLKYFSLFATIMIFTGCSSLESDNIKDWLKEGTKESQEEKKKINKTGKTNLKEYIERRGCLDGTSAKIIETENKDLLVYEVTCVTNSKKFIVKCDDKNCAE